MGDALGFADVQVERARKREFGERIGGKEACIEDLVSSTRLGVRIQQCSREQNLVDVKETRRRLGLEPKVGFPRIRIS